MKEPDHKPDALVTAFDSGVRNNAVEDLQSQAVLMGRWPTVNKWLWVVVCVVKLL